MKLTAVMFVQGMTHPAAHKSSGCRLKYDFTYILQVAVTSALRVQPLSDSAVHQQPGQR